MNSNIKTKLKTLASLAALLLTSTATAQTIYVDQSATGPAQDGSTWCTAYVFLQDALSSAAASPGSITEIHVANGTYKPDQGASQTPGDREETFQLQNNLVIKGGYPGCGAPDPNARDLEANETILSGDLLGNDLEVPVEELRDEPTRSENSYSVVMGSLTDPSASLTGCTITAGNATEFYQYSHRTNGGGLFVQNGTPTVSHCKFVKNSAHEGGAIRAAQGGDLSVISCIFYQNAATSFGGGLSNLRSNGVVVECAFEDNFAGAGAACTMLSKAAQEWPIVSSPQTRQTLAAGRC